jgi:hypothetical protein
LFGRHSGAYHSSLFIASGVSDLTRLAVAQKEEMPGEQSGAGRVLIKL